LKLVDIIIVCGTLPRTSAAYDGEHPWSLGDPFC